MPVMNDQNLSPVQILQVTRAMLSVATVDGIHSAEAALIGQFYKSSRSPDMPATAIVLATEEAKPFKFAELAGSSAEFADTLVLMCLMTAYADGQLTTAERAKVDEIATASGMDSARVEAHLAQVRDQLIGAISHLPDAGSVAVVLGELENAH